MQSADLIREARLRAGLSQQELAQRSGRDRSVIARWEQGAVAPSIDSLLDVIRACGFDLPLELVPHDPSREPDLPTAVDATPEKRLRQLLKADASELDPRPALAALERARVSYILVGALARFFAASTTSRRASRSSRPSALTTSGDSHERCASSEPTPLSSTATSSPAER